MKDTNIKFPLKADNGKISFPPLVTEGETAESWSKKRAQIKARIAAYMGDAPSKPPLRYQVLSQCSEENLNIQRIAYDTSKGEKVLAWLLAPKSEGMEQKYPGIIALHPTNVEFSDSIIQEESKEHSFHPYGLELARQGYVVIAPDVFCRYDHMPTKDLLVAYDTDSFYQKYPGWSAFGRMLFDHILAVDVLCALPFVDESRIGAIGHSLGAQNALFLAAFDERIKAGVANCGYSPFQEHPNVNVWCRDQWFCYMPSLKPCFEMGYAPFEWHELLALVMPRAFFTQQTDDDEWVRRWDGTRECCQRAAEVYELMGVENKQEFHLLEGIHQFTPEMRHHAYRFLEKHLK